MPAPTDREAAGALELDREELRTLGYQIVDHLVARADRIRAEPVAHIGRRDELEALLREPAPAQGRPPAEVLARALEVLQRVSHVDHPRFFAYVPGPGNLVSAFAEALAAGYNVFAGTWLGGAGAAMLELVTVDWLRELCGLPEGAAGILLSGGTAANLTGLAVARRAKLGDSLPGAVAYFCDQAHASVDRALRLLGFAPEQRRALPGDARYRLPVDALRAAVAADRAAGRRPFCVVASAGTTNCAAVDPLPEIADFCAAQDLWLHVDGAYGAAAVLTAEGGALLAGLGRADSLVVDPHKWLFQPFEVGCLMVRDGRLLRDTFRARPDYMQEVPLDLEEVSFHDYGLQLSRSFRALKLWMSLQVFGLDAFRAAVARGMDLARAAEALLRASPRFSIVTPAQLALVTFRYAPAAARSDAEACNRRLVEAVNADGFAMISSTVLAGRTALRLCTINPRTTAEDLAATVRRMEELGAAVEVSSP